MSKLTPVVVVVFSAMVAIVRTAPAQGHPTPADLMLRPGDTLTWNPAGPHRVQFGGTVTATVGGTPTTMTLTSPTDIEKVLTSFDPPLPLAPASGPDIRVFPAGRKVTAVVKSDAAAQNVPQFFFTCGAHPGLMVTVPFSIGPATNGQPARAVEIVSDPSFQWFLKTASGNKTLNVNKQ